LPDPKVEPRTSDDESIHAEALTLAAAGVSLSKQTMHRAHDPMAETADLGAYRLGRKTPRRNYARRFRYAPFAVGAALIWVALQGVKRKIPKTSRDPKTLKRLAKPIVVLCGIGLSGINI
jgi:hypothetical protein